MWRSSFSLILKQNRVAYGILILIGLCGPILCITTYPGDDGMEAFMGMDESSFLNLFFWDLWSDATTVNTGLFLYFVMLYFIAYMAITFPVVGLWLGGAGVTKEMNTSMADIFFVSPQKKEKLLYRHLLSHGVLFTFLTICFFLSIPLSFELLGTPINYIRVLNAFILLYASGLFFFAITFFISVLTVRNDIGRGVAGLILLASYFLHMLMGENSILSELKQINPLYYFNTGPILLKGDPLTNDILIPVLISIILLIVTIIVFKKRDPLPLQLMKRSKKTTNKSGDKNEIKEKGFFYQLLARISPITAEQWAADRVIFLFMFIFAVFSVWSIIAGYPKGEEGVNQLAQIYQNNPIAQAIIRGHNEIMLNDPLGSLYPQFFGYTWIYFFPLVFIGAGRIIRRDYDSKALDMMLGTPISSKQMIFYRMVTTAIQLVILSIFMVISLIIGEYWLGIQSKIAEQLISILIIPCVYISLLSCLIAIGIAIPKPSFRKPVIYGFTLLTVVLAILPYLNENLGSLQYLSLLYYFDLIGLVAYGYQITEMKLLIVLMGVFVISIAYIWKESDKINYI